MVNNNLVPPMLYKLPTPLCELRGTRVRTSAAMLLQDLRSVFFYMFPALLVFGIVGMVGKS